METITETKTRTDEVKEMVLGGLWELCYRAHSNTSFSPEKRANQYVAEYSEMLEEDLKELGDNQGNYKEKYISKFSDWMSAKGRCISSMITGGSNFPVRRAQKANDSERNKSDAFFHWREKYFKAVNRVRTPSPEEDLDNALLKLDKLVIFQDNMKSMNKIIKKVTKKDFIMSELVQTLRDEEFPEHLIKNSLADSGWWGLGFAPFSLTNNNAKIKATRDKVLIMKTRIERKDTWQDITFEGGYVTIEDDRVKIFHDEKPEKEIIQEIKKGGYRWSPHWGCWCRKHTGNAVFGLKYLSFINN